MPTNKNRDKASGTVDKLKGRVRDAAGALTGNRSQQTRGGMDQAKGEVKKRKGQAKDLVD